MIAFNGYLTDVAEKAFFKKSRNSNLIGAGVLILLALPNIFLVGKMILRDDAFIYAMLASLLLSAVIILVPKGKKLRKSTLPKKIYMDNTSIVCVADSYIESKLIRDVTKVIDYGYFYQVCFRLGKWSDKFICQKSLITKGSLREFESLFKGKLIRKKI